MEHGSWYATLSPREQATIDHALEYAANFSHAGVPGHSAHLLIAKLADLLDQYSQPANRHPMQALPAVDTSLLTPAEPSKVDLTKAPDVSKKPGGFA